MRSKGGAGTGRAGAADAIGARTVSCASRMRFDASVAGSAASITTVSRAGVPVTGSSSSRT